MIKCISYWSIENGLSNTRAPQEAMAEAANAGFAGIELAIAESGVLTPDTDQATCDSYRAHAARLGLQLDTLASGMSWSCSPTSPDPSVRERSIRLHEGALQRAAWLGAQAMLFVPGAVRIPWDASYAPVPYDRAFEWARQAVERLARVAERVGVDLCIENVWNGMFCSPLELRSFVDSFDSSRVGVYFDVGNVLGHQQYPPHWIELLGKRVKRVHFKDFKIAVGNLSGFCDLLDGDVPWPQTMAALREVGYDATIVAEMIPPTPGVLQRTSAAMDTILKM